MKHLQGHIRARDWITYADPNWLVLPKAYATLRVAWLFCLFAYASKLATLQTKKPSRLHRNGLVPETGFEPAHPFGRYHLKVVRLPISPPGLMV